jgi:hypothetical protein
MSQIHLKRWFSVLLSLSLVLGAARAAAAESTGSVVGVVVDADKKGVAAVDVTIYAAADTKKALATTETAKDGTFTLKDIPQGKGYVVKAVKRKSVLGVRADQKDVDVDAGKATDVGNLELKVPTKK